MRWDPGRSVKGKGGTHGEEKGNRRVRLLCSKAQSIATMDLAAMYGEPRRATKHSTGKPAPPRPTCWVAPRHSLTHNGIRRLNNPWQALTHNVKALVVDFLQDGRHGGVHEGPGFGSHPEERGAEWQGGWVPDTATDEAKLPTKAPFDAPSKGSKKRRLGAKRVSSVPPHIRVHQAAIKVERSDSCAGILGIGIRFHAGRGGQGRRDGDSRERGEGRRRC